MLYINNILYCTSYYYYLLFDVESPDKILQNNVRQKPYRKYKNENVPQSTWGMNLVPDNAPKKDVAQIITPSVISALEGAGGQCVKLYVQCVTPMQPLSTLGQLLESQAGEPIGDKAACKTNKQSDISRPSAFKGKWSQEFWSGVCAMI